jgi:hypothetical protein
MVALPIESPDITSKSFKCPSPRFPHLTISPLAEGDPPEGEVTSSLRGLPAEAGVHSYGETLVWFDGNWSKI